MKITLKSSLISFAIGIAFAAVSFVLMGCVTDLNVVVITGIYMALIGVGYCFVRKISPAKPLYFAGALIGTIVFYNIFVNSVSSTKLLAGIEYVVLLYAFIPVLCFDALTLLISAVIWYARSRKNDGESNVPTFSAGTHLLSLLTPIFVTIVSACLMFRYADPLVLLAAPSIIAYVYFYFKPYCKMELFYTLLLAVPYAITLIISLVVFLGVFYDDKSLYVIVATLTVLAVDVIAMLIKKISEKRKLSTCKNEQNMVQL